MLFQKRVDRAMKYSKDKAEENKGKVNPGEREEEFLSASLEKGDLLALIISALLVFLPAAMIVVLIMCFIGMMPAFF